MELIEALRKTMLKIEKMLRKQEHLEQFIKQKENSILIKVE